MTPRQTHQSLGALPESEPRERAGALRFKDSRIVERCDCFRNTSAELRVSKDLRLRSVDVLVRKPIRWRARCHGIS